ncbi:winged helix-turn-helix domain-containing protein [Saccharothrix deserti]|uniref:winged helix-turn-helix domain-containing protein n=1 Tax=Saccharothrix deserti TaxID=2593674 RepID=UPI00131B9236|nr:winged helix-turn-helix domain-containing protein [Saccharothrix deserti]
MEPLDPDDPRPPFQQVTNALRASILTRKFQPGDQLPGLPDLSEFYGVSIGTVQKAIAILRQEGLVVTRQGAGTFVRQRTERAVGLRPHVERAFTEQHVSIDFAGFSGETLYGVIQEPLDKIRIGRLTPEQIDIRVLLPDMDSPLGLPRRVDSGPSDSVDVRQRMERITRRSTQAIADSVTELVELGLVKKASVKFRLHDCAPLFKLFILNEGEAFFGFYPVVEHSVTIDDSPVAIYDPMGKDAVLFHHEATEDESDLGTQYVDQSRRWFDSMWNTIAKDFKP